mmetsp:Transcript_58710/g.169907  ORF Transcript_58710/g.169907 Transcript_58710/m.169907 type:complete len:211 (+) Transcript_58710:1087-1719(+)
MGGMLQDMQRRLEESHARGVGGEQRRRLGVQGRRRRGVRELQREHPLPNRLPLAGLGGLDAVLRVLRRRRSDARALLHPGGARRPALRSHRRLAAGGLRGPWERRGLPHRGAPSTPARSGRRPGRAGRHPWRHDAARGGADGAALCGLLQFGPAIRGNHRARDADVLVEERHRRRHPLGDLALPGRAWHRRRRPAGPPCDRGLRDPGAPG